MSGTRAIVVGAGIGGLTAAIALRRVGMDVTVLERANELRQIQLGTGLHIFPNAMHGFRQLDLDTRVAAVGMPVGRIQFRTSEGKLLSDIPMEEVCQRLGAPCVGVRRTHLHRVLLEAQGDVPLRMGAEVTGFTQNADGVVVRLADGREERADLLIGADGASSAIRAQLLGKERLLYHGYTSWLGLVEFKHEAAQARSA